jgi:hypothetical protein
MPTKYKIYYNVCFTIFFSLHTSFSFTKWFALWL